MITGAKKRFSLQGEKNERTEREINPAFALIFQCEKQREERRREKNKREEKKRRRNEKRENIFIFTRIDRVQKRTGGQEEDR